MSHGRLLVVIPTYQERDSLAATVSGVRSTVADADLLVVDDASPDGTGAVAEGLASADPRVHVLHRPAKQGLGIAYVAGFGWGLARGYQVIVQMDADGSHRPADLPHLLDALAGADVVIGSRWVSGGAVQRWTRRRTLLSRAGNWYVRTALGMPVHDATAGFRAWRSATLAALHLDSVASQGYCFQVDLTYRAVQAGCRVVEVPITFVERELGTSKMDGGIVREALVMVTAWGLGHRTRQLRGVVSKPVRAAVAGRRAR